MIKFFAFILLIFFASISDLSQTNLPESDFQVWNETQIVVPLKKSADKKSDRISFIFYGTLRASRYLETVSDKRAGVGFEFRFNKYVTFTPSYLYIADHNIRGDRTYESRLRFDLGMEKKFKHFSLKDRSRVEHRLRYSRIDSTRYRNKFQFTVPVKKDDKEIFAPFVATEPYYEFQTKHWTRNELSLGIQKKFNPHAGAEFFYMLQNNRGPVLKHVNIVGVNLKFRID